jgi:hypothetical protein
MKFITAFLTCVIKSKLSCFCIIFVVGAFLKMKKQFKDAGYYELRLSMLEPTGGKPAKIVNACD